MPQARSTRQQGRAFKQEGHPAVDAAFPLLHPAELPSGGSEAVEDGENAFGGGAVAGPVAGAGALPEVRPGCAAADGRGSHGVPSSSRTIQPPASWAGRPVSLASMRHSFAALLAPAAAACLLATAVPAQAATGQLVFYVDGAGRLGEPQPRPPAHVPRPTRSTEASRQVTGSRHAAGARYLCDDPFPQAAVPAPDGPSGKPNSGGPSLGRVCTLTSVQTTSRIRAHDFDI